LALHVPEPARNFTIVGYAPAVFLERGGQLAETKNESHLSENGGGEDSGDKVQAILRWAMRALLKWKWLCAVILVAGGCGAWPLVKQFVPLTYQATGAIMQRGVVVDPQISDVAPPPTDTRSAANLMRAADLYRTIRDEIAPGVPVNTLAKFFQVEDDGTLVIRVSMWWDDPDQAAKMVNRLMELFNENNNKNRQEYFKQLIEKGNFSQLVEARAKKEAEANKQLQAFLDQYKVADITSQIAILQSSLTRIQTLLQSTLQEKSTVTLLARGNEARIQEAIQTEEARLVALQVSLEPNIRSREASLVVLQQRVDRYKKGPYAKTRLEEAEAALKSAQVQLEGLRSQLANTVAKLKLIRDPDPAKAESAEIAALPPLLTERTSLQTRLRDADARIAAQELQAEEVQTQIAVLNRAKPDADRLQRDVTVARTDRENLDRRRRLLEEQALAGANEYTVTEVARPPVKPSGRARLKKWVIAMVGITFFCGLVALGLEHRSFPGAAGEADAGTHGMPVIARPTVCSELPGFLDGGRQLDQGVRDLSLRIRQVLT